MSRVHIRAPVNGPVRVLCGRLAESGISWCFDLAGQRYWPTPCLVCMKAAEKREKARAASHASCLAAVSELGETSEQALREGCGLAWDAGRRIEELETAVVVAIAKLIRLREHHLTDGDGNPCECETLAECHNVQTDLIAGALEVLTDGALADEYRETAR